MKSRLLLIYGWWKLNLISSVAICLQSAICLQKWGGLSLPPPCPPVPPAFPFYAFLSGSHSLNPARECGEALLAEPDRQTLYGAFWAENHASVTQKNNQPLNFVSQLEFWIDIVCKSNISVGITDNLVKSWVYYHYGTSPWSNLGVSGHRHTPGSPPLDFTVNVRK